MQNQRIYLKDYVSPAYQINQVHLDFDLQESATLVTSRMKIIQLRNEDLVLDGEQLELKSIELNEKPITDYKKTETHLTLSQLPKEFELRIVVQINPEANKSFDGLYYSGGNFCTQCEAEGFRKITYFLDRPDAMTSYTVLMQADEKKYPVLLSNGDCLEKKSLGNGRHQALWKDPFKKPSYLFALVAGDLGVVEDHFVTSSGKNVKLEVYAPHGKQARCEHAMTSLKKAMRWDEERFGLEYDLNQYMIVSIDDFNMGAMENKGLNIFNSRLVLADEKTATDKDFESIEAVVGHEYFHNWTGNRVTCRNWFELSLKEGLTVFRDQEFSADMNSRAVQRIKEVDSLRTRQFTEDAGPNSHPVRPESCLSVNNFYTATIYEKGAEVIRMMQTLVGRDGFRRGMDEYFKRHDGHAVTIDDFAAAISEPNNQDFTQFKRWYSQAGTPIVKVEESFSTGTAGAGTYELTLTQNYSEQHKNNQPFLIPLKYGLLDRSGQEIQNGLLLFKEKTHKFIFKNLKAKPILSLNREFSAPIKLDWEIPYSNYLHLIKFDTDTFNRREAFMTLLTREIRKLISDFTAQKILSVQAQIMEAFESVLVDDKIDPAYKALILTLPSNVVLAQEEDILQPRAFFAAKETIFKSVVQHFETQMLDLYHRHNQKDSAGDRDLKNLLLNYLIRGGANSGLELAQQQYQSAKNMTDSIDALMALCQSDLQDKNQYKSLALADFYSKWHQDSVVFNKWLNAQAGASVGQVFETVKACTRVPGFNPDNPNNLYNLHGVFGGNYLHFHTDQQPTYKWYVDELLRVDANNPQVAARLASAFNYTKKLPENLKTLAQTEIRRLLAEPKLSKNVRELLEKCV